MIELFQWITGLDLILVIIGMMLWILRMSWGGISSPMLKDRLTITVLVFAAFEIVAMTGCNVIAIFLTNAPVNCFASLLLAYSAAAKLNRVLRYPEPAFDRVKQTWREKRRQRAILKAIEKQFAQIDRSS